MSTLYITNIEDTCEFWVNTRIKGASSSIAGGEYADKEILNILDKYIPHNLPNLPHYVIVQESDIEFISNRVNKLIEQGYMPQGGISSSSNHYPVYTQALFLSSKK